jgi:hypothetical protein
MYDTSKSELSTSAWANKCDSIGQKKSVFGDVTAVCSDLATL